MAKRLSRRKQIGRSLFGSRWREAIATPDEIESVNTVEQEWIEMDEQNERAERVKVTP